MFSFLLGNSEFQLERIKNASFLTLFLVFYRKFLKLPKYFLKPQSECFLKLIMNICLIKLRKYKNSQNTL